MKTKLVIVTLFISLTICAQQLPMGKWRTHFAYNNITQITQSDDKVYAISNGSLFSIGKHDSEVQTYSKLSGLSDSNIYKIGWSTNQELLVIDYHNSNIYLYTRTNNVLNLTYIYDQNINVI